MIGPLLAKAKGWRSSDFPVNTKTDNNYPFVQMPYSILDSTLTSNAKVLFMHLWKDAFTNNKKHEGKHYSDMTQKQMASELGYQAKGHGLRKSTKAINELNQRQIIESKKYQSNRYWHFFLAKHKWEV